MRVIKEEDFIKLVQSGCIDIISGSADEFLKEIDALTVSRLRPMCDAPKDRPIFVVDKLREKDEFVHAYYCDNMWCLFFYPELISEDRLLGWRELPIYKPELTGDGE